MAKKLKPLAMPQTNDLLTPDLLGQYIRARRTQLGFTLEDAAAFCDVAKDTLMKLEHGQEKVQLYSVLKVCKALGIKLKVLPWDENEQDVWI